MKIEEFFENHIGIGVDIENINRFHTINSEVKDLFLEKVFTKNELNSTSISQNNLPQHFAAKFAGKEAIIKALSAFNFVNIDPLDIEIKNDEKGVPKATFINSFYSNLSIKISLSHCDDKVIAFAIIFEKYK